MTKGMVGTIVKVIENQENRITCKSCHTTRDKSQYKKHKDGYVCHCTAVVTSSGKVLDYGERDVYRVAQKIPLPKEEIIQTKRIELSCSCCGTENKVTIGSKWYTCIRCESYQHVGIICQCGNMFIPNNNTWVYECVHCKTYVDSEGNKANKNSYIVCGNCETPIYKQTTLLNTNNKDAIYQCTVCQARNDKHGDILRHEDLCKCKECHNLFIRERSRYQSNKALPTGTMYQCYACDSLLDFTGSCVDKGIMDKCNSCNKLFSRSYNCNHPWLIRCPTCNEYVDSHGDRINPKVLSECSQCNTLQNKYDLLDNGCVMCGYTEVEDGEVICQDCGTMFNDAELVTRGCMHCGGRIIYVGE